MNQFPAKVAKLQSVARNTFGLTPDAVFIWIPKSAGTSLFDSLSKLGCVKCKSIRSLKRAFPQRGLVTFGHMDYVALLETGLVSADFDQRSKKFAIVRNPYERAVSLYFYIRDRHKHFEHWRKIPSFEEFLEIIAAGFYDRIGLYNVKGLSQANPQIEWTRGINLDYIGRVEDMVESTAAIGKLIDRHLPEPEWLNRGRTSASGDLLTKHARYLIDSIYDEDFEQFAYKKGV